MKYTINYKHKKEITNLVIQNTRRLKNISISLKTVKWGSLIACFGYLGMNFLLPNMNVINVQNVPIKDYFHIGSNAFLIFALGSLFCIALKGLLSKFASIDINERVEEELEIAHSTLTYSFRTKYESNLNTRIVIQISLSKNVSAVYFSNIHKLNFKGNILCYYIENCNEVTLERTKPIILDEISIYDYFEPSLLNALKKIKGFELGVQENV